MRYFYRSNLLIGRKMLLNSFPLSLLKNGFLTLFLLVSIEIRLQVEPFFPFSGIPNLAHLDDSQLRNFIMVKADSGKVACAICSKELSSRQTVLDHIKAVHVCKRNVECQFCPLVFTTPRHRSVHVNKKHRDENRVNKIMMKTEAANI